MEVDFTKVNTIAIGSDDSEPTIYYGPVLETDSCGDELSDMELTFLLDTNLYSDICHKNESVTFRHFLMLSERYKVMIDPSFGICEQLRVSESTARTHLKHYSKHLDEWYSIDIPIKSQEQLLESSKNLIKGMKYNVRLLENYLAIIKYIYRSKGEFESKKQAYLELASVKELPQFGFILACGYLFWYAKDNLDNKDRIRQKIDKFMSIGETVEEENEILHNTATDILLFHNCLDVFNLKYNGTTEFPILATRDTVVGFLLKHLCFSHIFDTKGRKYKAGLTLRQFSPWEKNIRKDFYNFLAAAGKPISRDEEQQKVRLQNLEDLRIKYSTIID